MTTFLLTALELIKKLFHHVWMSVSSVKFYQNVFINYNGLGIKYILNLALISSFCSCLILLTYMHNIKQYLDNESVEFKSNNIEFILDQLPNLEYDGKSIIVNADDEPIIINNIKNQAIIAIDPNNKINPSLIVKVPVILRKDQMILNVFDQHGKINSSMPLIYTSIFGEEPKILTKEYIKSSLSKMFNISTQAIIFLIFPLLTLISLGQIISENLFLLLIIFIYLKLSKSEKSMRDGIRVVVFSCGFYELFQFLMLIGSIELNYAIWIIKAWSSFLMIAAVIKSTPKFTLMRN